MQNGNLKQQPRLFDCSDKSFFEVGTIYEEFTSSGRFGCVFKVLKTIEREGELYIKLYEFPIGHLEEPRTINVHYGDFTGCSYMSTTEVSSVEEYLQKYPEKFI